MGTFLKIVPKLGILFLDKPSFRYRLLAMPHQPRLQLARPLAERVPPDQALRAAGERHQDHNDTLVLGPMHLIAACCTKRRSAWPTRACRISPIV
jgi:hypothetical protein